MAQSVLTLVKISEYQSLKIEDLCTNFLLSIFIVILHAYCIKCCVFQTKKGEGEAWWLKKIKKGIPVREIISKE